MRRAPWGNRIPAISAPIGLAALASASLIGSAAMGVRQTFGLFMEPIALGGAFTLATVSFAIALHNIVWGVAQPFAGAASDRYGPGPVVATGALFLSGGLFVTAHASSSLLLVVGMGVLFGIGVSCTSFGVVLTAVGKLARPEGRSAAMGLASAGGSVGQVLLIPLAQGGMAHWGATAALAGLGLLTLVVAPLGYFLTSRGRPVVMPEAEPQLPLRLAVAQAIGNDGYCLLTLGFFTCGFQLAFIATHLPTYLGLCGLPANAGAMALAVIGLFNMLGSWGCGWLGGRFRQRNVLALVYLLRSVAIAAFLIAPKTDLTVGLFAAAMGLLWLGTIPLTTGVIARIFGVRHLGTLFGMCFLSHQVGSFIGAWAGGIVLQQTASYAAVWLATIAAGLVAAALHASIRDKPVTMALQA